MSEPEAQIKAARFARLSRMLAALEASDDQQDQTIHAFWVPGRIEVLGKHTDYGGGRSLLCAVERGICVVARAQVDQSFPRLRESPTLVRVTDATSGDSCEFELRADIAPAPGHWSNYPITVARRIAMNFSGQMRGADIIFESDLPPAAGVSSSSALVVAIFLALSAVNDLPQRAEYSGNIASPEDLGGYLGCVENGLDFKSLRGSEGVGTFGGSEDQTAILCSRANTLVQYSFCPVRFERAIALPPGYCFVVASSGVMAEKTGAALERYNRVALRLRVCLNAWRTTTGRDDPSMGAAIASIPGASERIREILRGSSYSDYPAHALLDRFDQFHAESNEIIPAAGDALERGDLVAFGDFVARSQSGAELALENQISETIALVQEARKLGALAASAFGAGFGGSVWALIDAASSAALRDAWRYGYASAFPDAFERADFFITRAGPAALRVR